MVIDCHLGCGPFPLDRFKGKPLHGVSSLIIWIVLVNVILVECGGHAQAQDIKRARVLMKIEQCPIRIPYRVNRGTSKRDGRSGLPERATCVASMPWIHTRTFSDQISRRSIQTFYSTLNA